MDISGNVNIFVPDLKTPSSPWSLARGWVCLMNNERELRPLAGHAPPESTACSVGCDVTWTARVCSSWGGERERGRERARFGRGRLTAQALYEARDWIHRMQKKYTERRNDPSFSSDGRQSATDEERNTNTTCHLTNALSVPVAACVCACFFKRTVLIRLFCWFGDLVLQRFVDFFFFSFNRWTN